MSAIDHDNVVVDTIRLDIIHSVAYNANNGNIYVANSVSHTVSVIDQDNEVLITTLVGYVLISFAYDSDNEYMCAVREGSALVLL